MTGKWWVSADTGHLDCWRREGQVWEGKDHPFWVQLVFIYIHLLYIYKHWHLEGGRKREYRLPEPGTTFSSLNEKCGSEDKGHVGSEVSRLSLVHESEFCFNLTLHAGTQGCSKTEFESKQYNET